MSSVGRNSSLFKDEPRAIPQPVRVSDASADLLDFHRAHKERIARMHGLPPSVPAVDEPAPEKMPDIDPYLEAIERAMTVPIIVQRDVIDIATSGFGAGNSPISFKEIQKLIAAQHGCSIEDLLSPVRTKHIVQPRQLAMFCTWAVKPNASLPEIGRRFGNRDHTTVLHAVRKLMRQHRVETRMAAEPIARQILSDAGYIWPQPKPDEEGEGE